MKCLAWLPALVLLVASCAPFHYIATPRANPYSFEDAPVRADLVERYADFPLGGSDASVIAIAERLSITTILTTDRRHFAAVRPAHIEAFTLLP